MSTAHVSLFLLAFTLLVGLGFWARRLQRDAARLRRATERRDQGSVHAQGRVLELAQRLGHAERAVRESEKHYRSIFDQAAVGIAKVSFDRALLDVNPGLREMLELDPSDLVGKTLRDLTHADDHPALDAALETLAEGAAENVSLAVRWRHRDPLHLWTQTELSIIRGEKNEPLSLVVVVRDITLQLRTEATLRFLAEASALLSAVSEQRSMLSRLAGLAVPDFADWCAVDFIGADGAVERLAVAGAANTGTLALAAGGPEVAADVPATHAAVARVLRTGQPQWIPAITQLTRYAAMPGEELRGLRDFGLKSYLCVPLAAHGRLVGALSFGLGPSGRRYDDGDLAAAQDLAHRVGTAVENARLYQELREADRRKDDFLATLGHELRNPLVPIRSGIDLLAIEKSGRDEVITLMRQQVEHLTRLVDDLLDVSRITRGRVELRRQTVPLSRIVRRAAAAMSEPLASQEQELRLQLPEEELWLDADPVRLVQVVENLLQNASKFTARRGWIELQCRRHNSQAVLAVRDTGIGMEPEMLARVFEPFTQAQGGKSRGGLGIGLALVRGLVEMHSGTVMASSGGPGQGSEFVVRLPLVEHHQAPASTRDGSAHTVATTGRRILVVDDNVEGARMLELLLHRMGPHLIATAHDGPEALSKLVTFGPELVLLDIGLPGMDGHEVGRRMRQSPSQSEVLIAALTGYGQEEDRQRSREAGFDAHLVKPPSIEDLQRLLAHPKLRATSPAQLAGAPSSPPR